MSRMQPRELNEHLAAREYVLLLFNKKDSQIAHSWSKPTQPKDMSDDED